MLERLNARDTRAKRTDAELTLRAARLARRYLPEHPDAAEPDQRALGGQSERPMGLVHAVRRHDPDLRADHGHAAVGDRLRGAARGRSPGRRRATTPSSGRWSIATRRPNAPADTSKGSPRSPAPSCTKIDVVTRRVVVVPLKAPTWTPPGLDAQSWRRALADDAVDLLATLAEVEPALAVETVGARLRRRGGLADHEGVRVGCSSTVSSRSWPPPRPTDSSRPRSSPPMRRTCPGC